VIFESEKNHLFLDISSTNINTLVPSFYQYLQTWSIEIFWLLSQLLPYPLFNLFISETFGTQLWTALHKSMSHRKQGFFFGISFALSNFSHKKKPHNRTLPFGSILLKHGRHFDYWNQPLNMRMRFCYLHFFFFWENHVYTKMAYAMPIRLSVAHSYKYLILS
jgi:hypothetical protein